MCPGVLPLFKIETIQPKNTLQSQAAIQVTKLKQNFLAAVSDVLNSADECWGVAIAIGYRLRDDQGREVGQLRQVASIAFG